MCGIAGIIGQANERNRVALKRMSDAMVHRGPDSAGSWESTPDSRGVAALLTHRRLAILDLSPAGNQPMVDPVSGDVIVYNGEVYNFQDLRARLAAEGQAFQSSGDTAVMLRALGLYGPSAVRWFRGMFTFAFWDESERTLLLARDPLGIKPLYVTRSGNSGAGWSIAFASEVRALLASGLLGKPGLDPQAVASVVWNGFVTGPHTAILGVESIWSGELRIFDAEGKQKVAEPYWTPPQPPINGMDEASLAEVLVDSVRRHLTSDVPLAVFLSGGVDSSAVANLAQRAAQTPVHTFNLAFEEDEFNEAPVARRIAEAIGTNHTEVVLSEQRFVSQLEPALDSLDQPTFDGLNSFHLSRAIRQAGFTVALVGTGGDELFGGYNSFRSLPLLHRWSKRLRWVPQSLLTAGAKLTASMLQSSRGSIAPQTRWAKLPDMVRRGEDLLSLYQLAYALFLPDFQSALIGDVSDGELVDGLPGTMRARILREIHGRSALSAVSWMEHRLFLGERLLRDNDAASMAASIEQRLPLVDQVLVESVDRLSDDVRYAPLGKKSLLRRIGLRGLDPGLFDRPKSGFVLPYDRWIRSGLSEAIDQTLRDPVVLRPVGLDPDSVGRLWRAYREGAPGLYWSRIWSIYVLVRWCHRHGVFR